MGPVFGVVIYRSVFTESVMQKQMLVRRDVYLNEAGDIVHSVGRKNQIHYSILFNFRSHNLSQAQQLCVIAKESYFPPKHCFLLLLRCCCSITRSMTHSVTAYVVNVDKTVVFL